MNTNQIFCLCRRSAAILLAGIANLAPLSAAPAAPANPANPTPAAPQNPFGPKPPPGADPAPPSSSGANPSNLPAGEKWVQAAREMLLQRFDQNKDGNLNAAEAAEARFVLSNGVRARGANPAQAGFAANGPLFGLRALLIQRFDKNGDGSLDDSELADLHQVLFGSDPSSPAALDALRQNILKQFDKNGDGKLDPAESAAAKAFLQQILADLDKSPATPTSPPTTPIIPHPSSLAPKAPSPITAPSTPAPKQN